MAEAGRRPTESPRETAPATDPDRPPWLIAIGSCEGALPALPGCPEAPIPHCAIRLHRGRSRRSPHPKVLPDALLGRRQKCKISSEFGDQSHRPARPRQTTVVRGVRQNFPARLSLPKSFPPLFMSLLGNILR